MYKSLFGKRKKMIFNSQAEYYETLGFLSKSDGSCTLVWENNQNQGAWGPEGRILCHNNLNKFTLPLTRKFTRGVGKKIKHRINCSEFVKNIIDNNDFEMGPVQNYTKIRATIPTQYLADFDKGYNL